MFTCLLLQFKLPGCSVHFFTSWNQKLNIVVGRRVLIYILQVITSKYSIISKIYYHMSFQVRKVCRCRLNFARSPCCYYRFRKLKCIVFPAALYFIHKRWVKIGWLGQNVWKVDTYNAHARTFSLTHTQACIWFLKITSFYKKKTDLTRLLRVWRFAPNCWRFPNSFVGIIGRVYLLSMPIP
jgi:hypothetical protein